MYLSAPISTRWQFAQLLADKGRCSHAVEVGTHRGAFARVFMERWPGFLTCVDPWSVPRGYERQAQALRLIGGAADRQDDYREAKKALSPWKSRVHLMRCLSEDAEASFGEGSLDFVYIDGDHEPPHVDDDLRLWWPKVRSGGLLAGHDWMCPGEEGGGWAKYVQPAVHRFAEKWRVDVHLVVEEAEGRTWSYFLVKP